FGSGFGGGGHVRCPFAGGAFELRSRPSTITISDIGHNASLTQVASSRSTGLVASMKSPSTTAAPYMLPKGEKFPVEPGNCAAIFADGDRPLKASGGRLFVARYERIDRSISQPMT